MSQYAIAVLRSIIAGQYGSLSPLRIIGGPPRRRHRFPFRIDSRNPSGVTYHNAASASISESAGTYSSSLNCSRRSAVLTVLRVIVGHDVAICPPHAVTKWSPSDIQRATEG